MEFNGLLDSAVPFTEGVSAFRTIIGLIIVFFIPGFAWTFVFFERLSAIERIIISTGLSIAIITLGVLILKFLFGMNVADSTSLMTIAVISLLAVMTNYIKKRIAKRTKVPYGD